MNPIAISIGNIEIRWYSILILIAFTLGYLLVLKRGREKGISTIHINDMSFYLVIFCILGARLYYCLFNFDYYKENLVEILKVWEGGLAIHGGIIAGLLFLFFYTRTHRIKFLDITDVIAPSLALGQAIGRWGNFFNSEAFGPKTTFFELQRLHIPKFIMDGMYINGTYHHPTFLYESIACFIIFIVLIIISKVKHVRLGQATGIYFILYGIVRFFIESLRQDSLMLGSFKVAQLVSIIMIVVGLMLTFIPVFRRKND